MLLSPGTSSPRMAQIAARLLGSLPASQRSIAMTYRGKPINEEEIYKYTNGHFLNDEERQFRKRYLKFDIAKLCRVAATTGSSEAPVVAIDKMEGGFCKALLMKKSDGAEIVAKLPTQMAGFPKYSTASEVATLKYVHENTTIPVPKVLAWDCDASNEVGAEYIIMERAPGVQLYSKWGDMGGRAKLALTRHLVKLESQLSSINFPASGSLYLKEAAGEFPECHSLPTSIDPTQSYCVGLSANRFWYIEPHAATPRPAFGIGPFSPIGNSLSDYGSDLTEREIFRISRERKTEDRPHRRDISADEESADLDAAKRIMKLLESSQSVVSSFLTPVLWHADLHMGNIYVSEQDPTEIVSIIDWQFTTVGPLFLQASWPEFLKPSEEYVCGIVKPQLPANFGQLSGAEQKLAMATRDDDTITKSYELLYSRSNKDVFSSLNLPSVFRELFIRSGEAAEEGTIALRACLKELYESWDSLGFSCECPLSFTKEELLRTEQQFKEYRAWHDVQEFARNYLNTDSDGWISPDIDPAVARKRNKTAFERYMKEMSKQIPSHEARQRWPFLEDV